MAAGEDQPQPVVLHRLRVIQRWVFGPCVVAVEVQRLEARAASQRIDDLEAPRGDQPRAGIVRQPLLRPLFQCGPKRLLQGFFSEVEVAEQSDQGGQYRAGLPRVDR